jgi:maleylacetate reductase
MASPHKLWHTLDDSFNLPQAEVRTVVLPLAFAFDAEAAPAAMGRIRRAPGVDIGVCAAAGLFDLSKANSAPTSLRAIDMQASGLDRTADAAVNNPHWDPRPTGRDGKACMRQLLQDALDGMRPR